MDDYNIHASIMLALRSHSMIFAIDFFTLVMLIWQAEWRI